MRVLYSHHGMRGKNGWGRTFYMAQGLADLGHEVTLLTINPQVSFFKTKIFVYKGVKIVELPDFFPAKVKSSGFAIWSTLFGFLYSLFHVFDLTIADCGHRFTSLPCKLNRKLYNAIYISEWWDFFGKGGYVEKKSKLFKLIFGKLECYNELNDKKNADAVIVLSSFMKKRAIECGINKNKIFVIPGGSIVNDIVPAYPRNKSADRTIKFAFIGINDCEIENITPFIEALQSDNLRSRIKLVLYGSKLSYENWIRYDLANIAEHRGWLDYTKDTSTLNDIDIFLQLLNDNNISKAGWPNKLGDYLAFGKPVMLAPYGDLVDFVRDKRGFFIVSYDKESIIKTLNEILKMPIEKLYQMGIENYHLAQTISWKNRAKSIEAIVNQKNRNCE